MKNINFLYHTRTALLFLITIGLFTSCKNSTSSEQEQEPVALVLKNNGSTVLTYNTDGSITGNLTITSGEKPTFTILFLDKDENEFTPEPEEHSITVTSQNGKFTAAKVNSDTAPFSFEMLITGFGDDFIVVTLNHVGAPEYGPISLPITFISDDANIQK